MRMKELLQFLSLEESKTTKRLFRRGVMFWLGLSLAFALIYGILALRQALSAEFVIQDDARQHVFWMQRFLDSGLFPQDLIADYFQSVAPTGYTWLYRIAAWLGIDPLLLSKVLPAILGLLSTVACFGVVLELFPVPVAAFVSSLLLNQMLWMNDDLISATPRAFLYPLFLGFCYFLLRRSLLPCVITIVLQGLFYPQSVFLAAGLLPFQVLRWQDQRISLSRSSKDYWFCGIGLLAAFIVMLPYALHLSQFDPVITVAEAKQMPEFQEDGRSDFFTNDAWKFWIEGIRSGVLPHISRLPELLIAALLLPIMLRFRGQFPLSQQVQPGIALLPQLLVVSLFWFFAAHALLFKLHLPSRYTQHTLRMILCWAAGIAIVIGLDALRQWASRATTQIQLKRGLAIGATGLVAAALVLYPSYKPEFPRTKYVVGTQPELYRFFAQQPKDTLIASLSEEASNLPSFAQRSVFVAKEYAIPYHMGYYRPLQQRAVDLIEAQYSPSLAKVKRFIRETGVDFWLLDRQAFTSDYVEEAWFQQYPEASKLARRNLKQGKTSALEQATSCTVFQNSDFAVLETACILNQRNPAASQKATSNNPSQSAGAVSANRNP